VAGREAIDAVADPMRVSNGLYGRGFYSRRAEITAVSASTMLRILRDVEPFSSMLDIGCGTGLWLKEAKELGAKRVLGFDGEWVARNALEVSDSEFIPCDFTQGLPRVNERFDVAMCMEVGEHLPESMASGLVDVLCGAADVVMFSAAVPGQGGTGHVNEQVQSWWWRHFRARGYVCYDLFRPRLWSDRSVNVVYRQNALVYVNRDLEDIQHERWLGMAGSPLRASFDLDRVHPELLAVRVGSFERALVERVSRLLTRDRK
jgi:SAM-dependent methyltransferase